MAEAGTSHSPRPMGLYVAFPLASMSALEHLYYVVAHLLTMMPWTAGKVGAVDRGRRIFHCPVVVVQSMWI